MYLPVSQRVPVYPSRQLQVNDPSLAKQVPSFWQVTESHGSENIMLKFKSENPLGMYSDELFAKILL